MFAPLFTILLVGTAVVVVILQVAGSTGQGVPPADPWHAEARAHEFFGRRWATIRSSESEGAPLEPVAVVMHIGEVARPGLARSVDE